MLAVFKREFKAYFANPLGFIFLAVIFFFIGFGFYQMFGAGAPMVEFAVLFPAQVGILFFVIPVITMRLFSDERRTKTDQVLFTAPVKLINIVLGKFLASFVLYAISFAPTIIFQIIVMSFVSVNVFYYIYALIGAMLFGAALIAVGMFISSLTESPIISIIFTLVANVFIMFAGSFAGMISVPSTTNNIFETVWAFILKTFVNFLNGMDFVNVLSSFSNQALALKDIVFFVSITAAFIFLTERSLEKRRWS
ncbi:MAG: hypothetical protein E7521_05110 [Ruminococcaceae bacterium]|nr:hypothetical protein [Oscillospiraceae bacterium]